MAVFDDDSEDKDSESGDRDDDENDSNGVGLSSQFLDPVSTLKDIQCEYIPSKRNTYPAHYQGGPGSIGFNIIIMGLDSRNPDFVACEEQMCQPACASAQSDQHHCHSLFEK